MLGNPKPYIKYAAAGLGTVLLWTKDAAVPTDFAGWWHYASSAGVFFLLGAGLLRMPSPGAVKA